MTSSAPISFERDAINRRAKHLAMARPFFALEGGKGHSDIDLSAYDMRRVALVILDCVIVEMGGVQRGAVYDTILRTVRRMLVAANPSCSDSEADRVTSYAIDALTNEREREAFKAIYQVQDEDGGMRWVTTRYWLLQVVEGPYGDPIYVAEPPAINFYLSSLEIEIEAAQAAKDGAHEYYMQRGRFGDAGQNAEDNLKLTISYREKLLRTVAVVSRDIRNVSYAADIMPTLNDATQHIKNRMEVEGRHSKDVDERLDVATGDGLVQLARLKQIFQRTNAFYISLTADVIGMDSQFLTEQSRQKFRPLGSLLGVADPVREVLHPVLTAPAAAVATWVETNPHRVLAASFPTVPGLVDLVALLLQDPQQRVGGEVTEEGDVQFLEPLIRFTPDDCDAVARLLDSVQTEARLSDLLRQTRADGLTPAAARFLVLRAFQCFEDGGAFVAFPAGALNDADFVGDDLVLRRASE